MSAVFGAGLVAIATYEPAHSDMTGGAPVFEITLFEDAGYAAQPAVKGAPSPTKPVTPSNPSDTSPPKAPSVAPPIPRIALASHATGEGSDHSTTPQVQSTASAAQASRGPSLNPSQVADERHGAYNAGASHADAVDDYEATVIRWIEKHKRHPGHLNGRVTLAFAVDRRGRMSDCRVITSSGESRLDSIALDQVRAAAPLPRPPRDATWTRRQIQVRLDYRSA